MSDPGDETPDWMADWTADERAQFGRIQDKMYRNWCRRHDMTEPTGCADDCCHPDHWHGVWNVYSGAAESPIFLGSVPAGTLGQDVFAVLRGSAHGTPTPGVKLEVLMPDTHDEWREMNDA